MKISWTGSDLMYYSCKLYLEQHTQYIPRARGVHYDNTRKDRVIYIHKKKNLEFPWK